MSTATCDIRFSLQNRYAGQRLVTALGKLGVSNAAVTVSGRATRSETEISKEEFVGMGTEAVRTALTRFLDKNGLPRAGDLVILDMEPNGFAPRNLGDFEGKEQRDLIAAYRRRIRVAREVLRRRKLPGLRLALYQVIVPDGKGRPSDDFERRMCGYIEAGRQGMYDELDFICPVLYQRFGVDDAQAETLSKWNAAASRQGIEGSLALSRSSGDRIPLVPVLSFWVFNGKSKNNRSAVLPDRLARQLDVVQQAAGVGAILFWSGWQTKREMESAAEPVEPIDINDFLLGAGSLPWPGCR